jgi:hypothetical protein
LQRRAGGEEQARPIYQPGLARDLAEERRKRRQVERELLRARLTERQMSQRLRTNGMMPSRLALRSLKPSSLELLIPMQKVAGSLSLQIAMF